MSSRTKQCKKRMLIFNILSTIIWICVAIFSTITVFIKAKNNNFGSNDYIAIKSGLVSLGIVVVVALFLCLFISNKLRTTLYMLSVMIATFVFGKVGMIVLFSIWFLDEYVFHTLAKFYTKKYSINKEIDLRDE